ncbi:MAG: cob(I)yrinic acid a,c-diamide adenosyltransferase [Candidatus Omnitrophica bacterium]|nr:cob(I)yrinic acid a,c-diamide adenosyltransferase [Candidatus Omnitrophota bacterium]MBU0896389.1 cob(I)yrinic acid a,c-diamide adenosyltransferase [Candidatus Omnitrophota bacterium]MBU1366652.1 cob(I)yrinic acid a,c-diamide adenosyltransferase [Candidatus Omnitrophota bacterium]MBU1810858.1 cob(I)yrinic acid a,c-diamide adenosyltransferase [Candidatus Omnitrophota bacterium]
MRRKGLIQIYTGDGKGKTTAAVGLAVRARGHGLRVCYVYFYKDPEKWGYSEHIVLKKVGVDVFAFAKSHPSCSKKTNLEDVRKDCLKGLDFIKKMYGQEEYDLLILDEINISVRDGFLKEEEILGILDSKPKSLELILTGRGATKKIIKKADLVSEIKKVKHPFDSGVKRRKGIEY